VIYNSDILESRLALISVIAIGAVVMVPLLDQMSSEINTDTTKTVDTDGI
jgi:hypothetical protein